MRTNRILVVLMLALLVAVASTAAFARPQENGVKRFDIGMIGDFPYAPGQQIEAQNLLDELNGEKLAFVTHDGDIKIGSTACTDDVYAQEYRRFESSENPFVYTPGDNEWTDCHRLPNPSPEEAYPLNRLALVRQTFFSDGYPLGQKEIPLQRQSEDYPENARWRYGDVTFATLHVVGSNNNRPPTANPTVGNEEEWRARNEANIAWLKEAFDAAESQNSRAVMLVTQANIFEADTAQSSGFAEFREALRDETIAFGKPVALVHGDSHYFRIDKPLYDEDGSRVLNFTRVETFGDKDVHWVRATIDIRDPEVYSFQPEIVDENVGP